MFVRQKNLSRLGVKHLPIIIIYYKFYMIVYRYVLLLYIAKIVFLLLSDKSNPHNLLSDQFHSPD